MKSNFRLNKIGQGISTSTNLKRILIINHPWDDKPVTGSLRDPRSKILVGKLSSVELEPSFLHQTRLMPIKRTDKKYGVSEASAATIGKDRKARLVMPMLLVVVKQQEEVYLARSSREWYHRPATEEEVACADRTAELNEDRRLETVRDGEEAERVVEGPHQFRHKMLKISTLLINQVNIFKLHSKHLEKIGILKDLNSR
ncbi:LOW QUALITY PROTEIN: hypothetical protein V1478_015629, partial [Vespula squamosa]